MQRMGPGRNASLLRGLWTAASVLYGGAAFANTNSPVLFNRDIRPLLSDTCFPCHGFDANKRKAELRLDTPEGATALHKGHQAVKGGDLKGSELWRRVTSTDPKVMMPPPDSNVNRSDSAAADSVAELTGFTMPRNVNTQVEALTSIGAVSTAEHCGRLTCASRPTSEAKDLFQPLEHVAGLGAGGR